MTLHLQVFMSGAQIKLSPSRNTGFTANDGETNMWLGNCWFRRKWNRNGPTRNRNRDIRNNRDAGSIKIPPNRVSCSISRIEQRVKARFRKCEEIAFTFRTVTWKEILMHHHWNWLWRWRFGNARSIKCDRIWSLRNGCDVNLFTWCVYWWRRKFNSLWITARQWIWEKLKKNYPFEYGHMVQNKTSI